MIQTADVGLFRHERFPTEYDTKTLLTLALISLHVAG